MKKQLEQTEREYSKTFKRTLVKRKSLKRGINKIIVTKMLKNLWKIMIIAQVRSNKLQTSEQPPSYSLITFKRTSTEAKASPNR